MDASATQPNFLQLNQKSTICSFCQRSTAWVINLSGPCRDLKQRQPLCSWNCAASTAAELLNKRKINQKVYDDIHALCLENLPVLTLIQRPDPRPKPSGKVMSVVQWNKIERAQSSGVPYLVQQAESSGKSSKKKIPKSGPEMAKALVDAGLIQSAVIFPLSNEMEPMIQAPFKVTGWQDMVMQTKRLRRLQLLMLPDQPPFLLIDDGMGPDVNHRATQQLRALAGDDAGNLFGNVLQVPYDGQDCAATISQ